MLTHRIFSVGTSGQGRRLEKIYIGGTNLDKGAAATVGKAQSLTQSLLSHGTKPLGLWGKNLLPPGYM